MNKENKDYFKRINHQLKKSSKENEKFNKETTQKFEELKKQIYSTGRDTTIKARGLIIEGAIHIERLMDAVLTNYFCLQRRHSDFMIKFLYDEYCNFGLKVRILEKLFLEKQLYKGFFLNLRELNSIRNIIAHSTPCNTLTGTEILVSKKLKPDSVQKLLKRFVDIYEKIRKALIILHEQIVKENTNNN